MKKKLFLILIGLLLFVNIGKIKAFPENLTKISQKGSTVYGSLGSYYSALKKSDNGYITICTRFNDTTPAKRKKTCELTNDWSKEIRAGVAYIIRKADISNSLTKANSNYVDTELAISEFLYKKGAGGDNISDRRVNSSWVDGAIDTYNTVENKMKNISISIGDIGVTEDNTNYYLTIPINTSYDYTVTVKKGSTTYSKSGNKYVIPKSTLSEGNNTISISATATYSWYQARKYSCGSGYQPVTPNLTELTQLISKDASKTITLKKETKGSIKIIKADENGNKIRLYREGDIPAKFNYYKNGICDGEGTLVEISPELGEYTVNDLVAGTYSIKEIQAPTGYIKDDQCHSITLTSSDLNKEIKVANIADCSTKLSALGSTPSVIDLLKLFKEYPENNELLNFSSPSCQHKTCDDNVEISCLSATSNITNFNENNLSCYDSDGAIQDVYGNYIGFCKSYLNLENKLGTDKFSGIAGQFLSKSDLVATATSTNTCYILKDNNVTIGNPLSLKLHFGDNDSDGDADELVSSSTPNPTETPVSTEYFTKYTKSTLYEFFLGQVYLEKMTGKVLPNSTKTSVTQRGLILPFNSNSEGILPFKIKYGTEEIIDNSCTYTSTPELITFENNDFGHLNIEFRTINTSTPFPGKNGNIRNTGSNWCDKESNTCSGDVTENKVIESTIKGRNNSYNQTQKGALYTITLTPSTIKEIKSYNKNTSYDDYNVNCDDTGNCANSFLSKFNIKRTNLDS